MTPGGVPGARGPAGPAGPRGAAIVITRGETSKKLLQIDWDHPVHVEAQPDAAPGTTVAAKARRALPLEEALREIAGDDHRPLLVLRECYACKGSDIALLSRELSNDRTVLLTTWFHCVKLPENVTSPDHPYHALFENHTHLFLSQRDGSGRVDFDGKQTQQQLWRVMGDLLRKTYDGSHEASVQELVKLLAQFDVLDEKEARLLKELDEELERRGYDSPRVRKLQAELKAAGEERKVLLARHKKLSELPLKPVPVAAR